jgi:hypothetical protein
MVSPGHVPGGSAIQNPHQAQPGQPILQALCRVQTAALKRREIIAKEVLASLFAEREG